MNAQPILKTEDARDLAVRIIEEHAGALFPKMDTQQLELGEQSFSVWRYKTDGECEEVGSCQGEDWRECAVSALTSALWQSRECWNERVIALE